MALYPIVWLRRKYLIHKLHTLGKRDPKKLAEHLYRAAMKKDLDWNNPQDLNEKINWLKFNTDLSEWSRLSDKYSVRKYLKERNREDLLVDLYGVWDNPDDIDFNLLPKKFVLKTNHGCGSVILVDNKLTINANEAKKQLKKWINEPFGIYTAEPQYKFIKLLCIAEQYLENDVANSTSLIDYKVFCLDGNPYCILVCANRIIGKRTHLTFYDLNWNIIPDILDGDHKMDLVLIDKPDCLEELLIAAKQLASGHPEVRVDFYIVNNKIYFGEMTFTSLGGYMNYITPRYLLEMGKLVTLPI